MKNLELKSLIAASVAAGALAVSAQAAPSKNLTPSGWLVAEEKHPGCSGEGKSGCGGKHKGAKKAHGAAKDLKHGAAPAPVEGEEEKK